MSDAADHVLVDRSGAVARVTLNRPDRLNALTDPMRDRITAAFTEFGQDPAVRVVILDAAGRGFCASGDVSNMGRFTAVSGRDRLRSAHRMIIAIANIEKPVIAAVRGPVAGIGWSMALACDMIVASETAVFSQVFRNVGLVPDGGAVYFLTQMLGVLRAKELVYTARKVAAAEAAQLGLVTRLVPDADLAADGRRAGAGPRHRAGLRVRRDQEDVQVDEHPHAGNLPGCRELGAGADPVVGGPRGGRGGVQGEAQTVVPGMLTRPAAA